MTLPRYAELSSIDLYMDQVLELINHTLSPILSEEIPLTKSMVNNYVKLGHLEKPQNKRYHKDQIAYLIVFVLLKNVATIPDTATTIFPALTLHTPADQSDAFCDAFEKALSDAAKPTDSALSYATSALASTIQLRKLL